MSRSAANHPLEVQVADFGPIVEAKVDFRPLTVFVGPSNTGKSYLAILVYALHRFFSRRLGTLPHFVDDISIALSGDPREMPRDVVACLREIAGSFRERPTPLGQDRVFLPSPVMKMIHSRLDVKVAFVLREICRCFGIDETRSLIRKGKKGARIVVQRGTSDDSGGFRYAWALDRKNVGTRTTVPSSGPIPIDSEVSAHLHHLSMGSVDGNEVWAWLVFKVLEDAVLRYGTGPLQLPAYYLPADRTGVMHAHNVVVSSLIRNAPMAGLRPGGLTGTLSGVLADFLEELITIDRQRPRKRSPERDLSSGIEEAILAGQVRVERSPAIDYPRFMYRPCGWNGTLPLMNSSSMVSELAPVVLYLRHVVEPGNVLIVEEPESHLHPAMQVEFTRQLAALVDAGVNVMITTHSEWLLEELANIVRRSQLPNAKRGQVALLPEQVGTWLFRPKRRPRGSIVTEIRLNDSGLYPSGFDEVAAALHNDWAEISSWVDNDS